MGRTAGCEGRLGGVSRGLVSGMRKAISALVCRDWVSRAQSGLCSRLGPKPVGLAGLPNPEALTAPAASGLLA